MIKKIFPILLMILVIISWANIFIEGYTKPKRYNALRQEGDALVEEGLYVKAVEKYKEAQNIKDVYEIIYKILNCYEMLEDNESYLAILKDTIEKYPDEVTSYIKIVDYYKNNQDMKQYISMISECYDRFPKNLDIKERYEESVGIYSINATNYKNVRIIDNEYYVTYEEQYDINTQEKKSIAVLRNQYDKCVFTYEIKDIRKFGSNYFIKDINNKWNLVNDKSYLLAKISEKNIENILGCCIDYAIGVADNKYYFINGEGDVSSFCYDYISASNENVFAIKKDNKWAYIVDGNIKYEGEYLYEDIVVNSFNQCYVNGRIVVKQDKKYYMINEKGEKITQDTYEFIKAFESAQPTVYKYNEKYGFITAEGNIYMESTYDDAMPYKNGYAAVKVGSKWGYIDQFGNMVIEPQYTEATNVFDSGRAFVMDEDGIWNTIVFSSVYYKEG